MDALHGMSAVLVAWFVLMGAGFTVSRAWGLRPGTSVVAAMPVSFGLVALFAISQALTSIRFSIVSVTWAFLLVALLGFALSRVHALTLGRRPAPDHGRTPALAGNLDERPELTALLLLGTVLVSGVIMLIAAGGTLETASQTYDGLAHQNEIRSIVESGIASPWRVDDYVSGPGAPFYPSGFTAVGAFVMGLLRSDSVFAANVTATVLAGGLWPSTVMILAGVVFGRAPRMVAVCGLLALGLWGMPWAPLGWGVLWPTAGGAAFTPVALAGLVAALGLSPLRLGAARALTLAALGLVGVGVFQPRGLLLAAPVMGLLVVVHLLAAHPRTRGTGTWARVLVPVVLLAPLAAALVVLVRLAPDAKFVAIDRPINESVASALTHYLVNGPNNTVPGVLVGVLVLVGIWEALQRRNTLWIPVTFCVLVLLDVMTATQRSEVAVSVSRFWYGDRYRSATTPPVVGVLLAALGVRATLRWLGAGLTRARRMPSGRLTVAVAGIAVALTVVSLIPGPAAYLRTKYFDASTKRGRSLVSPAEIEFFGRVAAIVPPDERILNNAQDGSALIYAYVNRLVVFNVGGDVPSSPGGTFLRNQLVTTPDRASVCRAFSAGHIKWVVNLGDPYTDEGVPPYPAPGMQIPDGFWATTLVAQSGDAKLYEVTGCG